MYYDEEDPQVIEVIYNGGRNATYTSDHRGTPRPAAPPKAGTSTVIYRNPQPSGPAPPVIYRNPPPPPAPAPATLLGIGVADWLKLAADAYAGYRQLPEAPPRATGDLTHDMNNMYDYQTSLALHWQQAQQVKVIVTGIGLFLGAKAA
jgi:hypothetical protein